MYWDPEVESPATIAVIGCGPVGIEAALYGRFLGYDVDLYDAKRPAHEVVRWNLRPLQVSVANCTTPLGISALQGQSPDYERPTPDRIWNGSEFANDYLLPIAKSDLLIDGVHINSRVLEVGRVRFYREEIESLQDRANDEFRLVIDSRDRGIYSARADIILDCRGLFRGDEGYGPGGAQASNASNSIPFIHPWLPGDPRFELRMLQSKHVIVFGNNERSVRFVEEWADCFSSKESNTKSDGAQTLTWLVPNNRSNNESIEVLDPERWKRAISFATSIIQTRGIERLDFDQNENVWTLAISQEDDSTVEITGDVFSAYPNKLPSQSLGPTLYCDQWASNLCFEDGFKEAIGERFYEEWHGWQQATGEPNYYRLGSKQSPYDERSLSECFNQIRSVFALLGGRVDLDLYDILRKQSA